MTLQTPGYVDPPPVLRHWQLVLKYFQYQRVLEYSLRYLDEYSSRKLLLVAALMLTKLREERKQEREDRKAQEQFDREERKQEREERRAQQKLLQEESKARQQREW